jgi:hypothetical protein
MRTQTQDIHWAAFVLDPISHLRAINAESKESAVEWILQHVEHKKEVSCSLQDFLLWQNGFTKAHMSQLHIDNLVRYWQCYFDHLDHDELA